MASGNGNGNGVDCQLPLATSDEYYAAVRKHGSLSLAGDAIVWLEASKLMCEKNLAR